MGTHPAHMMIGSPLMSHHRKFVVSSDIQQRFSPSLTKRAPNKLPVQDAFEDDQIGHSPMLQRYSKFNTSVMKYPNPIAIAQRFTTVNKSRKKGSSPKTTLDSVFVRRNEDSPIETVEISSVVENCNIVISVPNDKPTENWLLLDSNLPLNSNPINYGDLAAAIESTDNLDMNENHKNSPRMSVSRGTTTSTLNSLRRGRSLTHGKLNLYKTPSLQDSLNSSYRGYSQSEPKLRPQPAKPAVFDLFGNNNKSDDCCCHCAKQATPDLISDSPNVIRLSIDKGSPSIVRHLKCPNSILKSSKTREEPSVSLEFNCETQVSPDGKNIEEIGSDDGIVVTTPSATIPAIRISSACSLSTANSDETLATADPFEVQTVTVVADFDESDWEMPESPKSQLDTSDSTPTYESLTSRSHTPAAESLSSGSLYQHSLRNSLKSRFQSCPDLLEPCLNDFKPELNLLDRAKRKKKSRAKPSRSEYSWEGKPLAAWKLDDILVWLQHLGLDELASVLIGYDVSGDEIARWTPESLDSFGVGDKTKLILMEEIARLKEIEVSIHKKKSVSSSPSLYNVLSCESDYDAILPVELTGGPTQHHFSVAENPSGGLTVTSVKSNDLPLCIGDVIVELNGQRTLYMAAVDFNHQLRRKGKHKLVILRRNFGLASRMSMQSLLNGDQHGLGDILSSISSPTCQPLSRDDFDILHF